MATPPEVDQDQNMYDNFDEDVNVNVNVNENVDGPYVSIPQFYADRSVFITGGTGFMGKVNTIGLLMLHKNCYIHSIRFQFHFVFIGRC